VRHPPSYVFGPTILQVGAGEFLANAPEITEFFDVFLLDGEATSQAGLWAGGLKLAQKIACGLQDDEPMVLWFLGYAGTPAKLSVLQRTNKTGDSPVRHAVCVPIV
jgi:hypothetical protein